MLIVVLTISMPRSTLSRPFGYEPDPILAKQQMVELVHALNRTRIATHEVTRPDEERLVRLRPSEMQIELYRLITLWKKSGPNLRKMFRKNPELAERAGAGSTVFYTLPYGRGYLDWFPIANERAASSPQDQALRYFMTLITNPQWEMLGGPCRRCKDFFLKKTRRRRIYCSRKCGSRITAVQAVKRHRQQEHAKKIQRARNAKEEWGKRRRRLSWKEWVSNATGYSVKWITRAVTSGELRQPRDA